MYNKMVNKSMENKCNPQLGNSQNWKAKIILKNMASFLNLKPIRKEH